MEPNLEAELLFKAVETIMDPSVTVEARRHAYQVCEHFKEKSPLCAHCGLLLSSKENPPVVRHFGLQLIEHHIKFKWNVLTQQEKVSLKQNAMNLLTAGTNFILDEEAHIKDAMARIIVEMIKREWPQQWPELLSELNDLCAMGPTQKELVCLIFLRLAEDVVTLQTVQNQRRRELYQALTGNLEQIFAFFVSALNGHYSQYRSLKCEPEDQQKAMVHCRLTNTILFTLAGFVEWVPLYHITADDSILLQTLWRIVEDDLLQLCAIECLLLIAGRKGKTDERKPILRLFSEDAMNIICSASGLTYMAPATDPKYATLKKLCQLFIALGGQLCALWVPNVDFQAPSTFPMFLNTVLSFTKHPSQVLSRYTQSLWTMFLNHKCISEDQVFKSIIPAVVESCMDKLVKVGFPSGNDYPSCFYSKSEFDSDEDFNGFFGKFRSEICDTLRCATVANPAITFEYASERLYKQLQKDTKGWENEFCNMTSPLYLEWEALANCLESVMGRIPLADPSQTSAQEGIKLLGAVLSYETQDPLILSSVISCISALHEFLTLAPDQLLQRVLEKLFVSVVFSQPGQTKATRSKAVKNVRRHACSFLVKISKQHPRLLLPHFKSIYDYVKNISSDPDQLSQMEKCTLVEALILISNEFHEYEHQSSFLKDILQPVYSAWQNAEAQQAFLNIDGFMTHIGLNAEPVTPSVEDIKGINRSQMTYCLNTMLGVIRRTKWPDDREVANKGGYICSNVGRSDSTYMYFRNPAKPHIYPLLEKLLHLASILNTLWEPESRSKIHPGFITALDILEAEKNMILGLTTPPESMDSNYKPLDRMQYFLSTAHDSCYHILGNCGPSLGVEFYAADGLAQQIITHALTNLQLIPDYRLRPIIRVFLKPFIQYCPTEHEATAIIPILEVLCPFMYKRLIKKWSAFLQRSNSRDNQRVSDNNETQEVLEDQLNRQLSRDYLDVLGAVLTSNKKVLEVEEMMDDDGDTGRTPSQSDSLSELGIKSLKNKVIWPSAVLTVFNGLHWQDTLMCIKCIPLCVPILKQLIEDSRITQEAEASFFLQCILLGLKELGEHATNEAFLIGLGVQIYELLRPQFPCLRAIMLQCPSCDEKSLECFEEKILNVPVNKQVSEKKKKDMFRKLVNAIIGVNVGQQHKNPVRILNLPPIRKKEENLGLFNIDKEEFFLDLLYELRN